MPLTLINLLRKYQDQFHPVVDFDPGKDSLLRMDLSSEQTELNEEIINDTTLYTQWVNERISAAGAKYAIGGYAENRMVYSFSRLFDGTNGEEPRRLHLGTDIWGKPHTRVMSPFDGIIHSFADNNGKGDYGGTIILTHHLEHHSFHTLYGHLSLSSLKNLCEGDRVHAGEVIAEFGIPSENGQWPPHLHFQIIKDIDGWKGDYPGVCRLSEKDVWLVNCPDPDLVLNMNRYLR